MARKGYLDGADMAGTFNALRANDLIFNYVASNWLMGEQPPAFDLLAWNADSTRLPAAMHSWYLRSCYMENQLAKGTMRLGGQRLDLAAVMSDTYIVAAERDHIVPWTSSYESTGLLGGDVRFVLSSGGHIAGIVNPPNPKSWVLTSDANPPSAQQWRDGASQQDESWWEDWARWMADRAGPLAKPPRIGKSPPPRAGGWSRRLRPRLIPASWCPRRAPGRAPPALKLIRTAPAGRRRRRVDRVRAVLDRGRPLREDLTRARTSPNIRAWAVLCELPNGGTGCWLALFRLVPPDGDGPTQLKIHGCARDRR
jgi:hypothetical protein